MSAALQMQPAVPGGQQIPAQITPAMIQQILNIGEEEATQLLQILPQLCQAAQPQFQQSQEFQNIQQGVADLIEFHGFLNTINSPIVTDEERKMLATVDMPTLFELAVGTNRLFMAGSPTKDAMARITWTDQVTKNINAKQIAEWILETLIPRIIEPLYVGQEELVNAVALLTQESVMMQQQRGTTQQGVPPQQQAPAQGAVPGQGVGMGGQPQGQNQRYPWRNSKGDQLWYKILQKDSSGKKSFMSDSLEMDVVKDSIKIDENGVLTADAVMTAAMVQKYMRDGKEQKVLKDPKELKQACDNWYPLGMPCTDQHPPEGMIMNQDEKVGWTTMPVWDEENKCVSCQVTIQDGKTVKKIQDGNTDVSIGFFCDLHEDPGTFGQDSYEAVQRNIVFNHLAVGLDKGHGRCPDGTCGIKGDKKDAAEPEVIDWSQYEHLPCVGDTHYDWLMQKDLDTKLSAEQRAALPESDFCGPGRSFPVPDCAHYTAALRMLGRYQGPGDKTEIKDCIIEKGKTLDCPGATDAEMTLHKQLLKERTEALVEMTKTLAEKGTDLEPEELEELMDGIRELMWKLRDEIQIVKGRNIAAGEVQMKEATAAYGDAAILTHTISTAGSEEKVKEGKYRLEPGYPDTHDHYVTLDTDGNGTSTVNDEHSHKVVGMNVELSNDHSHNLVPHSSEEEPSMTDEEKKLKAEQDKAKAEAEKKAADEKAAAEKKAANEPENKASSGDEAEPIEEKPAEKDEASQYVADMIKAEHTKMVDAIMDSNPPKEREFYEKKSLDELKELKEFLDSVSGGENFIPTGKKPRSDSTQAVDDAYDAMETKLRTE